MRYLSSRANIVGSLAALAALGAHLGLVGAGTVGLGNLWPVAVAGVYGLGAVLAGRDKVDLHVDTGAVEIGQLRKDTDQLRNRLRQYGDRRLPPDARRAVTDLLGTVDLILQRGEALAGNPEALHTVGQTVRDYVPTSLEAYLNLPPTFARSKRVDQQRSAHEELLAQLGLLQKELTRITDALYSGDARSLADQGRFLEEKFRRSDLDLPPQDHPAQERSELDLN